jgi:16S rRNA (cytidine1402-2'-O)-methyltransferase
MTQDSLKPGLFLLPNLLGEHRYHELFLPNSVDKVMVTLDGLIAESPGAGRRYLDRFETKKPAATIPIALYNEHTPDEDLDFLLEPICKGERWGYVSDAGLPCIADPGAKLVRRARALGLPIQAFIGPSSITLSLMLSGLPGQHFTFHGYLDAHGEKRRQQIVLLEKQSREHQSTQIFMEAPYRNRALLEDLINTLNDKTWLCTAWDLTMPTQGLLSQPIAIWKKSPLPNLDKKNTQFLINAVVK